MENPITLQEERKVWTIHQSVSGLTYYYNRATKKSQYEMPECFKTTEEILQHPEWRQYRTAEGKKFYYNATSRKSCWHMPNEVKELKIKLEEQKKKQKQNNNGVHPIIQEDKLSETEEVKKKFITLLKSKSISVNTKWDSCIKLCEDDERWSLLKISEKKRIFNDYLSQLKKINEMEKKAKAEMNRVQFVKMLKENRNLNSSCKMHRVAYDFIGDSRWKLLDDIQRENVFQNYLDELMVKEKEEAKESKLKCCEVLKQQMEEDAVTYTLKWDEFKQKYKNDPNYKELHSYDRISTFVDYILEQQRQHEEQNIRDKKLKERTNRINFRTLLRNKLLDGDINYRTKWKKFVNDNKNQKYLLNMMDPQQQGSSAHEIYEHFMFYLKENHKVFKGLLKNHFKRKGFRMTEETSNDQFQEKLEDLPEFQSLRDFVKQYFYKYFLQKIKAKNQNKQLSAKKALRKEKRTIFKIFKELKDTLKTKYSIEEHMEKIEKGMKDIGIIISHESIFKYYLAFLEGSESSKNKKSPSRSNSYSSGSSKKNKKRRRNHNEEEPLNSIPIPSNLKGLKDGNEMEEEGEIKDEEIEEKQRKKKIKNHRKNRRRSSSSYSQ